jgi:hypothetical protein
MPREFVDHVKPELFPDKLSLHQHVSSSHSAFRQGVFGEEIDFDPETPPYSSNPAPAMTKYRRVRFRKRMKMLRQLGTMQELCIAAGGNFCDGVI